MTTHHDLTALLSPRSVAVVGASRSKHSIGFAILDNLLQNGFQGPIYPVNPHSAAIHSLRCYKEVGDVPEPVDLAIIVVPKGIVPVAIDACLEHGAKSFVVITAGFAETGQAGAKVEAGILETLRDSGARMIGPNCMGIINTDSRVQLNATFAPTPALQGSLAFASQSGALGVAILNEAQRIGIGFTQFVSMGNKTDVSGNDLLEHWEKDEATKVIALYLESIGNARRFTELSKRVGRKKPILMVKAGRTEAGARAASSHTGALADSNAAVSALTEQCGIVRVRTLYELFNVTKAFVSCRLPRGNKLAIVTNAGGPGIMTVDAAITRGLELARFGNDTLNTLASFLPPEASLENPVDMIASADAESYRRALDAVLEDDAVDMAIAIHVTPIPVHPEAVMTAIGDVARKHRNKPLASVMMTNEAFYQWLLEQHDLPPVYHFPESATQAMAHLYRYAKWRSKPVDDVVPEFAVNDVAVGRLLAQEDSGYVSQSTAWQILEAYGIPVARWRRSKSVKEAVDHSQQLGFPVAVKAEAPGLIHKSDIGAVALDLRTTNDVAEACNHMTRALDTAGLSPSSFIIQEYAAKELEMIFGFSVQDRLGPLLMFGLGGKYVEVFQDVRFGLSPLSRLDALEMIRGIRARPMLQGIRGDKAADENVLVDVLLRLAQLAHRHPSIAELDINPFFAASRPGLSRAVDVRLRKRD